MLVTEDIFRAAATSLIYLKNTTSDPRYQDLVLTPIVCARKRQARYDNGDYYKVTFYAVTPDNIKEEVKEENKSQPFNLICGSVVHKMIMAHDFTVGNVTCKFDR